MTDQSRRSFIKRASIGAAAVGAVAVVPGVTNSAGAATPEDNSGAAHDGPFTVWVNDARSGEIAVLVGETQVVHHDPALARSLARIAARGTSDTNA